MTKNFYITTPIYYVNDIPHIGHAYTTIACDVLARFKRLDGFQVKFLTGTDEHGQKVEKSAEKAGIAPQDFTDKVSQNFRDLTEFMQITNTDFIRTTETRHKKSVQEIWQRLLDNGHIYLGSYDGWYAVRDEAFYAEDELTTNAEGNKVAPSGAEVEWVSEPSYFFRLSAWQEPLLKFYEENPDFILPKTRRNEVLSFVKGGLNDLSISRTTFKWGINVPNDDQHIMYVWLDALTNYITSTGFPDTEAEDYKNFWPADIHMVGKDILRFHAVYWPAFLMGAGLQTPKRIFAHGWWTNEGQKISKSLGNVIDPIKLVEEFGLEQVRYYMLREVPFGNDGDFNQQSMINRINGELANDFGNLAQRSLSMVYKNCNATIPAAGPFTEEDQKLLGAAHNLLVKCRGAADNQLFHEYLEAVWIVIRAANGYVDAQAPWALKKTDTERMNTVLYVLIETVRHLAILMQPFTPDATGKMLDQLSLGAGDRDFSSLGPDGALKAGVEIPKPEGVFPRYVVAENP